MRIEFKTPDDDDGYTLGVADWPCVPRIGEQVCLNRVITRQADDDAHDNKVPPAHSKPIVFEVMAVDYEAGVTYSDRGSNVIDAAEVTVWLVLPAVDRPWEGAVRG